MNVLERLLNPAGIAVIGASADAARPGGQTVAALRQQGYRGGVFPVNPKYPEIGGYKCYASLSDVDGECDLAVIALPATQAAQAIAQCAARSVPYAIVLGGGFRESGEEGAALERTMLDTARKGRVRVVGPNCLGLVNVHSRAYACFGSLTRPPTLEPGGVSVLLQSASFGMSVVVQCAAEGVGFRYVVTSGNEADLSAPELIDAYIADPETRVILAYLEGVNDGRAFMSTAQRALAAGKPLVVLKAGNTEQGRRAAESHTANLTGDYDIYRAAFRQCGVVEVTDVHEAVDLTRCLVGERLPKGRRVVVIGGSGGAAAMFSDKADELGLTMPALAPQTVDVLSKTLPRLSSLKNPVDYTAGYPREAPDLDFERAFQALADDPGSDQVAVMFAAAGRNQLEYGARVLAAVVAHTDKPIVAFSGMTEALAGNALKAFREAGIPALASPKRVAVAMAKLADYAHARQRAREPHAASGKVFTAPSVTAETGALDEHTSKRLLADIGVRVTRDRLLTLEPDAAACADLPYPVVLKIVSRDILHKTDVGGVKLDVRDADALQAAAAEIATSVRRGAPDARLEGLLACEMVPDGLETIAGVVNDPGFGPVVVFGLGGIFTEVLHDVTYRVAPFGLDEAKSMIAELRGAALFGGVRGQPPRDVDALADALVRLSQLAWHLRDRLAELDINPLLVLPAGRGVVAADALAVVR